MIPRTLRDGFSLWRHPRKAWTCAVVIVDLNAHGLARIGDRFQPIHRVVGERSQLGASVDRVLNAQAISTPVIDVRGYLGVGILDGIDQAGGVILDGSSGTFLQPYPLVSAES